MYVKLYANAVNVYCVRKDIFVFECSVRTVACLDDNASNQPHFIFELL